MRIPNIKDLEQYKNRWYGKYRAFVRDNHDPERLGRVRLEVPAVLGTGEGNWSDWAAPCFPYGGNPDEGTFLVPGEGASVWAEFEGGDPQFPIWTGVWLARSNPGEQAAESEALCESALCADCDDAGDHGAGADNLEHSRFHGHPAYYCPRMRVLLKTETGHTILASDRDGRECLEIIDRAGQSILLDGAVLPEAQAGNALARGTRTARAGDHGELWEGLVDQQGRILLTDAARQSILLDAKKDAEKIVLSSGDVDKARWQAIEIDTSAGQEKIHLKGLLGLQEVLIDSAAGGEKIRVKDKLGQVILLDAAAGSIEARDVSRSSVLMQGGNIKATAVAAIQATAGTSIALSAPTIRLN